MTRLMRLAAMALSIACVLTAGAAGAQTAQPPYGAPLGIDMARKVMAAAEAEAEKGNWAVVITILDSGGNMVMMHRLDNSQLASIAISEGKARTALNFKRPSKVVEDAVTAGGAGTRFLTLHGITAIEGGYPIVVDGKVVGAIGVSGVLSSQDSQAAKAGADAAAK